MKVLGIHHDSVVDGSGIRDVIFFAGCSHHCKGCFSPESWNHDNGYDLKLEDILVELDDRNDVTISGGDPFFKGNREDLCHLVEALKIQKNKNIWVYTGYTVDELFEDIHRGDLTTAKALSYIDVLVDGEFKIEEKDITLMYKGSRNQRVIDMNRTIKEEKLILYNSEKVE